MSSQPRPGLKSPRAWTVWTLPPASLLYVLAVDAAALGGFAASAVTGGFGGRRDLLLFALLTVCGLACVEAMRRIGEVAGVAQDLMSVWTLPVALLLPGPYALLAAIPGRCRAQRTGTPSPPYRQIFSLASIGLAHLAANRIFHAAVGARPLHDWDGAAPILLLLALAVGVLDAAANSLLVATAIRLSSPGRWREVLPDRETLQLIAVEISAAVVVAALVADSPVLVLAALAPTIMLQRSLLHAQLRTAARTDAKTGLLNAAIWQLELERELARAARDHRPVSVLLLDLDHFKAVNDTHGHLVGDQVLVEIADLLRSDLRGIDLIGRFGGEEFVAALTADAAAARHIAARVCRRIAAHTVEFDGHLVSVTASIGITTLAPGDTASPTELLATADAALYRAKGAGRNRIAHI
ncbi:MAG: GGDEF domain-containing protein [Mycobacteriales bacterium]